MATRGIIAVERAQGWRGRYVHWDNNPEYRVPTIAQLVQRDGLLQVVDTLINKHPSWSCIDPRQQPEPELDHDSGIMAVEGYGRYHTDCDPLADDTWFTEKDIDLAWAEFVYIMSAEGLQVCKVELREEGGEMAVPTQFHTWDSLTQEVMA